jgi:hypothetical protein
LSAALGRFWGQIEVDNNPDFDGSEVDPHGISSGYMMLFDFAPSAFRRGPAKTGR